MLTLTRRQRLATYADAFMLGLTLAGFVAGVAERVSRSVLAEHQAEQDARYPFSVLREPPTVRVYDDVPGPCTDAECPACRPETAEQKPETD